MDAFRRALSGETPEDGCGAVANLTLKPNASMELVKARPCQVVPEEMEWLENQMQQLRAVGMVRLNKHATGASVAMAVPKEQGFWMVADYRAANVQVALEPWPMPDLEVARVRFTGVQYSVLWT